MLASPTEITVRFIAMIAMAVALGCGHPDAPVPPESKIRGPDVAVERASTLPPLARELLSPRMHQRAEDLAALHAAVLSVDHDAARAAARAILAEPRLSRPVPEVGQTLNDEIPAEFFALQDRMVSATRAVEVAATRHDDDALSVAYGELTTACVACHATYLRIPICSGDHCAR